MMADKIMLIRHGEKPGQDSGPGVDANGQTDPESLTATGWQRASALVEIFHPASGAPRAGLAVPAYLFAANDHDGASSKRPLETLTPLAQSFNPPLDIDFAIHASDTKGIAHAADACAGVVLVAWRHEEILDIAARLAPAATLPAKWPGDRFDVIFVFDRNVAGAYDFTQMPELALPSDGAPTL